MTPSKNLAARTSERRRDSRCQIEDELCPHRARVGGHQDEAGATRPYLVPLDRSAAVELPLKEPRSGAAVTPAPNGTLAVIGGLLPDGTGATHIEVLFPE